MEGRLFDKAELTVERPGRLVVRPDLQRDLVTSAFDSPCDTLLHEHGADPATSPVRIDHHSELGNTCSDLDPDYSHQLILGRSEQSSYVLRADEAFKTFSTGLAIEWAFPADPFLLAGDGVKEREPRVEIFNGRLTNAEGCLTLDRHNLVDSSRLHTRRFRPVPGDLGCRLLGAGVTFAKLVDSALLIDRGVRNRNK
jgi:hypothetical protein